MFYWVLFITSFQWELWSEELKIYLNWHIISILSRWWFEHFWSDSWSWNPKTIRIMFWIRHLKTIHFLSCQTSGWKPYSKKYWITLSNNYNFWGKTNLYKYLHTRWTILTTFSITLYSYTEYKHKVDKTEGASDQFSIWIFNFWPYGQLRAVASKGKKSNYELWATFELGFFIFSWAKKIFFDFFFYIAASALKICIK